LGGNARQIVAVSASLFGFPATVDKLHGAWLQQDARREQEEG
jgi:hypothetical protein